MSAISSILDQFNRLAFALLTEYHGIGPESFKAIIPLLPTNVLGLIETDLEDRSYVMLDNQPALRKALKLSGPDGLTDEHRRAFQIVADRHANRTDP